MQERQFLNLSKSTVVQIATFLHDLFAAAAAFLCAFFLRLGVDGFPVFTTSLFWFQCFSFVALSAIIARSVGLNRGLWRYASMPDMIAIVKTGVLTTLIFSLFMFMVDRLVSIPRTAIVISCVLLIFFLSASRIAYRMLRSRRAQRRGYRHIKETVLLVGSGDGADLFIRAAKERHDMHFNIRAVFDDSGRRSGLKIRDIQIIAGSVALIRLIEQNKIEGSPLTAFVLTKPITEFPSDLIDNLINLGAENSIELKQLPSFESPDHVDGIRIEPRSVLIEDLLARPSASLNTNGLDAMLGDATVIVTGAGGSIGSQLCREIMPFKPKHLVLLDASEYNLYSIDQEMQQVAENTETQITPLFCDVRQAHNLIRIFKSLRPKIVFHAAALKHVPIVQSQPIEGLHTNVLGSRNVVDAATICGADAMVMISTDKAVNPTSVMGASKRAAELYCQMKDLESSTRCVIVRFGNVLGSAGSVVPRFQKQIAIGGPVTVTHPDITRYFMTIPEASQLVLQAAYLGLKSETNRGHVHVLDMGKPIKIVNLAKKMITLSGLRPEVDIKIEYSGLRPGEKLYEELFKKDEKPVGSKTKGILIATPPGVSKAEITEFLKAVSEVVKTGNSVEAVKLLVNLIPEAQITDIDHLEPTKEGSSVVELPSPKNRVH